jgi:multiple sugar transport system ATP-binding protein
MIYVTHDQVEAMTLGQRIVVFSGGRIEQVGTPLDLYHRPANLFVAGFLGSPKINFLQAEAVASAPDFIAVRLPSGDVVEVAAAGGGAARGARFTLGVRPEHAVLLPEQAQEDGEEAGLIQVTVGHVEFLGDQAIVYVRLAGTDAAGVDMMAVRHLSEQAPPAPGSTAKLRLPPQRCLLFDTNGNTVFPA